MLESLRLVISKRAALLLTRMFATYTKSVLVYHLPIYLVRPCLLITFQTLCTGSARVSCITFQALCTGGARVSCITLPCFPVAPASPVSPFKPAPFGGARVSCITFQPCAPVAPASPVSPFKPCAPVAPASPVSPFGPVWPSVPKLFCTADVIPTVSRHTNEVGNRLHCSYIHCVNI
jgi:hypothetical protein